MEELTISEVARHTGLRPSAIRYYESLDLLPPPRRVSGQRRYESKTIERLIFISTARNLGFSLAEIATLVKDQPALLPMRERWQIVAKKKLDEIAILIQNAQSIQHLLQEGMNCACSDLEDCIDCVLERCQK